MKPSEKTDLKNLFAKKSYDNLKKYENFMKNHEKNIAFTDFKKKIISWIFNIFRSNFV